MARVLAIANQKGGVGKTTTAVNLAASLAVAEQRTLLVDGDPQGNATSGIGLSGEHIRSTVYDALIRDVPLEEAVLRAVQFPRLDVAPSTPDLAGAEIELIDRPRRELAMREALEPLRSQYDFILIDCPPSLGLLTVNMLVAADAVIIPLQCEYYALEGLTQLLNTVHRIQQGLNPELSIDGVLLTMYDARLNLSRQVVADAREYFGSRVFNAVIPRNVRLAEAPSFGKPIVVYDVASIGAQAYLGAAQELIARYAPAVTVVETTIAVGDEQTAMSPPSHEPEASDSASTDADTPQPHSTDGGDSTDVPYNAEKSVGITESSEPPVIEELVSNSHESETTPDRPIPIDSAADTAPEVTEAGNASDQTKAAGTSDQPSTAFVHSEPPHVE